MIQEESFKAHAEGQQADAGDASYALLIDRLASGDLDESQRLDLLAWLDEQPARWRRCGLALMEAQSLREAFAPVATARGPAGRTRILRMLAAAAAVLLAFVLGWSGGSRGGHRPELAGGHETQTSPQASTGRSAVPIDSPPPQEVLPAGQRDIEGPPGRLVTLVQLRVGEGENARDVTLPVFDPAMANEALANAPSSIPPYLRQHWERQGYRVTEQRRSIPLKLADGREVVLPIDRVMLTYVGQPSL